MVNLNPLGVHLNLIRPTTCTTSCPNHRKLMTEPKREISWYLAESLNPINFASKLIGLIALLLVSPKSSLNKHRIIKLKRVTIKNIFASPAIIWSFQISINCKTKHIKMTIPFNNKYHPNAIKVMKVHVMETMVATIGFMLNSMLFLYFNNLGNGDAT